MSDMPDPNRPPEASPEMLTYRSGAEDAPRIHPVVQGVLGFLGSAVLMLGSGFIGAISGNNAGFALSICVSVGILFILATYLQSDRKTRGWALGIWLGCGTVGLLEGACFVSFNRL